MDFTLCYYEQECQPLCLDRSDHLKNHMKSHSNGRWLVPTDEANYHDLKHTHMTYSKEKMHTKGGNSLVSTLGHSLRELSRFGGGRQSTST